MTGWLGWLLIKVGLSIAAPCVAVLVIGDEMHLPSVSSIAGVGVFSGICIGMLGALIGLWSL